MRGKIMKFVVLAGLLLGVAGCKQKSGSGEEGAAASSGTGGAVVAKVGDQVITLKDFEQQIAQQNPLVRSRYKSAEQKQKLLDSLVEREAMVLEAQRLGLDKDPDVVRGLKKILARHLVNVEFNQKRVRELTISDEEIERYYQENSDRYHAPEKVRIHQIFFRADRSDAKARKEARKRAEDILKQLQANPKDRRAFLTLAREHSDDEATKKVGGDTNFKTHAEMEQAYGKGFADVAFGLKQAHDLSGVVETDAGFYLLRMSGKQAAIDLPLEKVKGQIRTTLFARARGEAYKTFVQEVKSKVGVQVFADVVEKARVETDATMPLDRPKPNERPGGMVPPGGKGGIKLRPHPPGKHPPRMERVPHQGDAAKPAPGSRPQPK